MKRCPSCNCENAAISMYCERCGFLLDANSNEYTHAAQAMYNTVNEEVSLPPPPQSAPSLHTSGVENNYYAAPQSSGYQMDGPVYAYAPTSYAPNVASYSPPVISRRRTVGGSIVSSILYLWGLVWAILGLFGIYLKDLNEGFLGLIIFGGLLLGLVILVLLLILYKEPRLKTGWRVIGSLGVTVLGFFALFIGEALFMAHKYPTGIESNMQNYYLGIPLAIYGLAMAVVAFL